MYIYMLDYSGLLGGLKRRPHSIVMLRESTVADFFHAPFVSGGHRGFSQVVWTVKEFVGGGDSPYITLYYHSFDGEQGNTGSHTLPQSSKKKTHLFFFPEPIFSLTKH